MPGLEYKWGMNTIEYNIILSRDHILIDSGDILLVDTGSPLSFHENGIIHIGDEVIPVATSLMEVDSTYVSDKVGQPVSGLLGMDIIGRMGMKIDLPAGKLSFSPSK